jgi:hypothetical protein
MRVREKSRSMFVWILVLILTLTVVGTVAAQEEDGDEEEPSLFEHPVVAAFRAYFGDVVAEEVIAYHGGGGAEGGEGEDGGVGYGVLVKMYAMAAESQEACAVSEEPCVPVTVEELMVAYKSGVGMGELFKEYGKPSVLGVGHLKKGDKGGPPDHAGPKDKGGPPDHAGPKDKDKDSPKDKGKDK